MFLPYAKYFLAVVGLAGFLLVAEPSAIYLNVPLLKQETNGCGAACIAMVVRYWADHAEGIAPDVWEPRTIFRLLYSKEAKGIYASDMESYFKEHGFRTFVFGAEWSDLENHISKGRPLIVSWDLNGEGDRLHYVVVVGLDPQSGVVFVNDPAQKKVRKISRFVFQKSWRPMKRWTLLAVPEHAE